MSTRSRLDDGTISRRSFLATAMALAATRSAGRTTARYATPFKYGRLVLSAAQEVGAFDSRSVDCPFVFSHDHQFYMAYVGYDGAGYQTGLAASRDLVDWRRIGCILKRDPASPITRHNVAMNWILRENDLRSKGALRKVRGRYLGAWHAYPSPGYESGPAVIGLCWSEDLLCWELDAPCLRPEDGAEWERGGLYKPCLLERHGTYYLFYNAKNAAPRRWREQIGVASSTDLKTWKRHDANPIIPNGGPGSPDERFAADPCVLLDDDRWLVFYYGLDARGRARDLLAIGANAYRPEKVDEILIDVGAPGSVDETYAHKPSVIWNDGALYHFYCAVSGKYPNDVRGISVARSQEWRR